jgi:hypothetical protein
LVTFAPFLQSLDVSVHWKPVDMDVRDIHENRNREACALDPDLSNPPIGGRDNAFADTSRGIAKEEGEKRPNGDRRHV